MPSDNCNFKNFLFFATIPIHHADRNISGTGNSVKAKLCVHAGLVVHLSPRTTTIKMTLCDECQIEVYPDGVGPGVGPTQLTLKVHSYVFASP